LSSSTPLPPSKPAETATSVIPALEATIASRRDDGSARPSYVVTLLEGGRPAIHAKLREEVAELIDATPESGADADRPHVIHEAADVLFHLLVLLGHERITWGEVEAELHRRRGQSGLEEKARRGENRPG
jgi:phosphoribosyl-ATP pyrophosphohydrolase